MAAQTNGRVQIDAFEMFLSDLTATKDVVKRAKLRGAGRRIFLGGSCNPTTWRKDIAIPLLVRARRAAACRACNCACRAGGCMCG